MVQEINPTYASDSLSRGLQQGTNQGNNLSQYLLPLLLARGVNANIYGTPLGGSKPPVPNPSNPVNPPINQQPPTTGQRNSAETTSEGIFKTFTPAESDAVIARMLSQGATQEQAQKRLEQFENRSEKNLSELEKLSASTPGMEGRVEELLDFAKQHPEIQNVRDLMKSAKAEFGRIEQLEVPGFWSKLIHGPEYRKNTLKNQILPVVQSYKESGQEAEARRWMEEQGLNQTEQSYQLYPPKESLERSLKSLPDSPFKTKSSIRMNAEDDKNFAQHKYEKALQKNPDLVAKQKERLVDFWKSNLTPETSPLVIRDELWDKGYPWQLSWEAFNEAFPDKKVLNQTQFSEIPSLSQAPQSSLADLFSADFWKRVSARFQGKR